MKLKAKVRVPESPCPGCGKKNDGASGTTTQYPEPGNVSLCLYCAAVSTYDENLQLVAWPAASPLPPHVVELRERLLAREAVGAVSV